MFRGWRSRTAFPNGHFHSPVVDVDELARRADRLWPGEPQVLGVDFNDDSHRFVLGELFPRYVGDFDYPAEAPRDGPAYFTQNGQFGWLDAPALFVLLRHLAPRRIVEVGSGYSSLLMRDVNDRFLVKSGAAEITCIEPHPRAFLRATAALRLIERAVQDVPLDEFTRMQAGDVLFIDSSHVAKTGSDVNFLYFDVLPRLARGVWIHVHDIFLPEEYPLDWVLRDNRSWNEQYLLRALLMYSRAFRPVFGSNYAFRRFPELVSAALRRPSGGSYGGGSFWMEKVDG